MNQDNQPVIHREAEEYEYHLQSGLLPEKIEELKQEGRDEMREERHEQWQKERERDKF